MKIAIINGINLQCLGTREINIYGEVSFDDYLKDLRKEFQDIDIEYFQSNNVTAVVEALYKFENYDGIILNPGAFTHTSIILADAIGAIKTPVVEVHISNLFGREMYRRHSISASKCAGFISGFGLDGYRMAIYHFAHLNLQR